MSARLFRLAGLLLFAIAFAVPAVRVSSSDAPTNTQPGWVCAMVATAANGSLVHPAAGGPFRSEASFSIPLILSGWVNPLFLLALVLSFWSKALTARRVLAALILLCFAASWVFFVHVGMTPLIGHVIWVLGPALAFVPDFAGRLLERKPATPAA